jgi:hypothetical protein
MTKGRVFLLFSAGIIAGGGVVAIVMNQFFSQPKTAQKQAPKVVSNSETSEVKKEGKHIPVESTSLYIDKKLPIRIKGDTTSDYYKNIDENSEVYDSLLAKNNSNEVNINRDQLLESLKVRVKYLKLEKQSAEDSLLNKMNNIKTGTKPSTIEVEIWQSPIHYKGYKLGKNKLVVYGIDPDSDILLFDLNDYVLLQSGSVYYRLEKTSDFKNLKKFNDQAVISRLK